MLMNLRMDATAVGKEQRADGTKGQDYVYLLGTHTCKLWPIRASELELTHGLKGLDNPIRLLSYANLLDYELAPREELVVRVGYEEYTVRDSNLSKKPYSYILEKRRR